MRDPFTLIEENGYFYGRGTLDDKAMAAVWVDTLIRYKAELCEAARCEPRPLRDVCCPVKH